MLATIQQLWSAFLLREETYAQMRDDAKRVQRAIVLILVVGVIVGAVSAWNQIVDWGFSPSMDRMQEIVLKHLVRMPWYAEMSTEPQAVDGFKQGYNMGWQIAKAVAPSPTALANLITTPLSLLIGWLVYGVLVHLSARLLGGQADLGQTLGCTALSVAPQLLNLIMLIPYATAAGIGVWALACNFVAVKTAHRLTTERTLIAIFLPWAVAILLGVSFACCGTAVIIPATAGMGGGR
ncbi:MAG: YIP1 family protein [Thermoflexales bacterium]|nr:YIP1 family protein [Thermoflexales bacterium]